MDGFLDKFVTKSCGNKICNDEGWGDDNPSFNINQEQTCSYCRHWAEKAITIDEDKRRQYVSDLRGFLDDLNSSKVFNLNRL